jgi:rSAM/selenodomain-associated transferase 1
MTVLAVIAKAPMAGASKTRLSPPLTVEQAASLAEAALRDTLAAVLAACAATRRVLILEGQPGPWLPGGLEVIPQRGAGLDERLASAFVDLSEPALIVGMDTPQASPALLDRGLRLLERTPAVLGPASDGGYWAIGLRTPEPRAILAVPMSSVDTLAAQRRRLEALGLARGELPELRDVDTYSDALEVAQQAPASRFAEALAALSPLLEAA